jgi:hypothetical protein
VHGKPRFRGATARLAVIAFSLITEACGDDPASAPIRGDDLLPYLSGEAAVAIQRYGEFPAVRTEAWRDEIFGTFAAEIAVAWIQRFLGQIVGVLERDRGAPIDVARLRPCSRQFYAQSAYGPLPSVATEAVQRIAGPHWVVPFCVGADQQVSVSVSVFAESVDAAGVNVFVVGVAPHKSAPMQPEDAAVDVATRTRRRVARVPELVAIEYGMTPQFALWRVTLDRPVSVRSLESLARWDASEVYLAISENWSSTLLAKDPADVAQPVDTVPGVLPPLPITRRVEIPASLTPIAVVNQ